MNWVDIYLQRADGVRQDQTANEMYCPIVILTVPKCLVFAVITSKA